MHSILTVQRKKDSYLINEIKQKKEEGEEKKQKGKTFIFVLNSKILLIRHFSVLHTDSNRILFLLE